MIVLHGLWLGRQMHLWGEDFASEGNGGASVSSDDHMRRHPAAASPANLHAAVGELSPDGLLASIASEASIGLWLPAIGNEPLPSVDMKRDSAACDGDDVVLMPFTVPTLALPPAEAIDMLAPLPELPPRGCGASLRYWALLSRYLIGLLARGQFVPDINRTAGDEVHACWRAVLRETKELAWLESLVQTMPPMCRAAISSNGDKPANAAALTESFLQACTDAVIRRALEADAFFRQIHERAAGDAPWEVRWLSALIGDRRVLPRAQEDRAAFLDQVRSWLGQVDEVGREEPTRLCFELLEPEDSPDPEEEEEAKEETADESNRGWHLRLRLQSLDDRTKLHDIAEVWTDDASAPALLRRRLAGKREHLLSDLARAAEEFPRIKDMLASPAPTGIAISAVEAHTFIRDSAPLLEARGFGVLLPEWAQQPDRRLGLRLTVSPSSRGAPTGAVAAAGMGLGTLVDFEWQVAVGDGDLTVEEFDELCARNAPLVRLRGEWVFFDAEAARSAVQFLESQGQGQMTLGQAMRAASGVDNLGVGLPVVGIRASDWLEHLLRDAAGAVLDERSQPPEFVGTMRPYQLRGLSWLAFMDRIGVGACLADDMGLGKTIQLIALLLDEKDRGISAGPTLVFAPMSVVGNWQREMEHFGPKLNVLVHHGPDRLTGSAFVEAAAKADAVITTYALGHRDRETLEKVAWHRLVLDEAQKVKNPSAAQTIAIRSLPSTYRLAMTGTPLENHLSELWSIMEMLNPGLLGSAADFRRRFAVPVERLGDSARAAQLKRLIHPFILRRVKSDPNVECDLPEKMEMRVYCNLTAEQAALYERVVATTLGEVEHATGIRRRGVILAALTKLKQICNHPAHFLCDGSDLDHRSGKGERLVEMLEEVMAESDAALIFTQFRQMGDLLVRQLTERLHTECLFLHGGTSAKQRQALVDRFQDPASGVRVFVLSLRAGGLGLNLTAANHVFHFDRWWNPAVEQQATDRAHRIGQTRRVQVHKFVCIGTIEDRIDRMLAEKMTLAENIVGSGDDWITGLTTEELRKYLALSREAIGDV